MSERYGYVCALKDVYEFINDMKEKVHTLENYRLLCDIASEISLRIKIEVICEEKEEKGLDARISIQEKRKEKETYTPGPTL